MSTPLSTTSPERSGFAAKKTRILSPSAVMTRSGNETCHSGALQRLQRGSRQLITTRFPNEAFQFPKNHQP